MIIFIQRECCAMAMTRNWRERVHGYTVMKYGDEG
jgi:hypothetical protein